MNPTFLNPPHHYTREEFRTYVAGLKWNDWKPTIPYAHNTGVPSLKQWEAMGNTSQERFGANLNSYYKGLTWHAGPAAVACPNYIWALCDFTLPGVAQSCSNSIAWAIEHVGNYCTGGDDPFTGEGLKVWENGAWAIAVIAEAVGWGDLSDYIFNKKGLHFHHDCAKDHHACPGNLITKTWLLPMIAEFRKQIKASPITINNPPVSHLFNLTTATGVQQALKALHFDIVIDGSFGPLSNNVLHSYEKIKGLPISDFTNGLNQVVAAALTKDVAS